MFKMIRKRVKEDRGDASFIIGLLLIFCLMLVGGTMLDFSKARTMKEAYNDSASKATQAAIMEQNSRGYLKVSSISKALVTYENVTRAYSVNRDNKLSTCPGVKPSDVQIIVTLKNDSGQERQYSTTRANIPVVKNVVENSNGQNELRNAQKQIENGIDPTLKKDIMTGAFQASTIQLDLVEGTQNMVLPIGFKLTGGGDGMMCQKLAISAKASTFTGDENGDFD